MERLQRCYTVTVRLLYSSISRFALGIIVLCLVLSTARANFQNTIAHDALLLNDEALFARVESEQNEPIELTISTMGRDLRLQLQPSRFNALAQTHINSAAPVLLQGKIIGDINSWVRLSVDKASMSGHLFHNGSLLQLEHKDNLPALGVRASGNTEHVVFEPTELPGASGLLQNVIAKDNIQFAPAYPLSNNQSYSAWANAAVIEKQQSLVSPKADAFGTTVTRALRVGIVVDSRFDEAHKNRGLARALSIMSSVDAIYQSQLGIALIVEAIRVYDDPATDPMRDKGGTVGQILSNFRSIRFNDERLPADLSLVHLFTGHRDPERVIGLGWISTVCRLDGYDMSVSTPFPFDTLLAAHEIAHNLGAVHDDDERCEVDNASKPHTLMWPEISGISTTEFSNCSRSFMQASKNASCNLDTIDASIDIRTYPSSEELRRSIVIEVLNNDPLGRSTAMASQTEFPAGTLFTDISAGCIALNNATLECNHGSVRAGSGSSVSVAATLPNSAQQNVIANVELLNASDINTGDNRKAIQLLELVAGEASAADLTVLRGREEGGNSGDFIGGIGNASFVLLLGLGLFGVVRRRLRL